MELSPDVLPEALTGTCTVSTMLGDERIAAVKYAQEFTTKK